jgi:hypothetical protein
LQRLRLRLAQGLHVDLLHERFLQCRGGAERHLAQQPRVQPQRDGADTRQHRRACHAPHPFAGAQRALHRGEQAPAEQQRRRQRGARARRIGQQQQRGAQARAVQRGARQDQPQDRPRARRPQQPRAHAQQQRREHRRARADGRLLPRQPQAQRHQRAREPVGHRGQQQRHAEQRQHRQRRVAPVLVQRDHPAAAHRRQRGDGGKGQRHAQQHGQAVGAKGAVGAREHEGQHRQDARAQDGEHTTQVGDDEEQHGVVLGKGR